MLANALSAPQATYCVCSLPITLLARCARTCSRTIAYPPFWILENHGRSCSERPSYIRIALRHVALISVVADRRRNTRRQTV